MTRATTIQPTPDELEALPDRAARAWQLRCVVDHRGGPIYRVREDDSEHLVDLREGTCDGADYDYRGAYCKHLRRVAIAVARGEVPPPDSPRVEQRIEALPPAETYYRCTACGYESGYTSMRRQGCPRCTGDDQDDASTDTQATEATAESGAQAGGNTTDRPARTDGGSSEVHNE